jgi:hypothetical protein
MTEAEKEILLMGLAALALGVSGWILPYKWNLLRLRRRYAGAVSEATNKRVPRLVGSLLILVGTVIIAGVFAMRATGTAS